MVLLDFIDKIDQLNIFLKFQTMPQKGYAQHKTKLTLLKLVLGV